MNEWNLKTMSTRCIALALWLLSGAPSAQQGTEPASTEPAPEPPIIIDSDDGTYDHRSGVTRVSGNVTIQRGAMRVWADSGVLYQEDGRTRSVELTGQPVRWNDLLDDGTRVEGESSRVVYDVTENLITLTGNARLKHSRGEFTGDELVYDLDTENMAGRTTGDGNRVRVVIEPETVREAGAETDDDEGAPPTADESGADTADLTSPPATGTDEVLVDGVSQAAAGAEAEADQDTAEPAEPAQTPEPDPPGLR